MTKYLVVVGKSKVVETEDEEKALATTIEEFTQELKTASSLGFTASVTEAPSQFVTRPVIRDRAVTVVLRETAPTPEKPTQKRKTK